MLERFDIKYLGRLLILAAIPLTGMSQQHSIQEQYEFKSLTIDDGLSNNRVVTIAQDNYGFMWFGTVNGLDRFDGLSVVSFKHDPGDPTTISDNRIRTLFCDSRGRFWIGNNSGLDYFNSESGTFDHFSHNLVSQGIGAVYAIEEDGFKNLWIGSINGLYIYNIDSNEFRKYENTHVDSDEMPNGRVDKICIDKNNNIWFSIYKNRVCFLDMKTGKLSSYQNVPGDPTSLSGNYLERIYEDRAGDIWFGTVDHGLNRFNRETNDFTRVIINPNETYTTRVRAIFEDLDGNFFVGTRDGLYMRDESTGSFFEYASPNHKFSTLSQSSILCSFIDKTGSLWLGTFAGGVNYCDMMRKNFVRYSAEEGNPHFLNAPNVYAIDEDDFGNVWIATDRGINILDRKSGKFQLVLNNPKDPHSLSYNDVKCLANAGDGDMWIGTNQGGINYYQHKTGRFIHYRADQNDPNSVSYDKIYGLLYDDRKNLWVFSGINTLGVGALDMLPNGSKKFRPMSKNAYLAMTQSTDGKIWIGSVDGLLCYEREVDSLISINDKHLTGKVFAITEDSRKKLWIGTQSDLIRFDPVLNQFVSLTELGAFPTNREVYGILEDSKENLWISTSNGLLKLQEAVRSIENVAIREYGKKDGLQSKQFNYNAYHKNNRGELMFGGINGFNIFYPHQITENQIAPSLVFTKLKIFNKDVSIGKKVNGDILLQKSISETQSLVLSHRNNLFTVEFAALHFAQSKANRYRYMLVGFDEEWNYTSSERNYASYNNLDPGSYELIVNASNADGLWASQPLNLKITIVPPFWNTWWFRTSTLIILLLAVYLYVRWRTYYLKQSRKVMAKEIAARTDELKAAQNEIIRGEKMASIGILTSGVAHEINNPLNCVHGGIQLLREDADGTKELKFDDKMSLLKFMNEGSVRIAAIVKELHNLNHNTKSEKQWCNVKELIIIMVDSMDLRSHVTVQIAFCEEECLLFADLSKLRQLLLNILNNAEDAISDGGVIKITTETYQDRLVITVQDNGRGIPDKDLLRVTDPFYTTKSPGEGTGLGLSICYEIMREHGGSLDINSTFGSGTTIRLEFPLTVTSNGQKVEL